ncbi:MAG: hypothetical protein AB1422_03380, partial [bacterium]
MDTESSRPNQHNLFITRFKKLDNTQGVSKITAFIDQKIIKGLLSLFVIGTVVFCFNGVAQAANGDVVIKLVDQFGTPVIGGTVTLKTVGDVGTVAVDGGFNDADGVPDGTITVSKGTMTIAGADDGDAWENATATAAGYVGSWTTNIVGTPTLPPGTYSLAHPNYGTISLWFGFKIEAWDELNCWKYLREGTTTLILGDGLGQVRATYSSGYLYLAATGTGQGTLTIHGYVATATTFFYDSSTQTLISLKGIKYGFKVNGVDELGQVMNLRPGTTTLMLGSGLTQIDNATCSAGALYFAGTGEDKGTVTVTGYIATGTTFTYGSLSQVEKTLVGIKYGFKVRAKDELGQDIVLRIGTTTLMLGSGLTQIDNATCSAGALYFAGTGEDKGTVTVTGYIATGTTFTYGSLSQVEKTLVGIKYGFKVRAKDELGQDIVLRIGTTTLILGSGLTQRDAATCSDGALY